MPNLNEYESEYCDSIAYYSNQLSKLAAENAELTSGLLQVNQFDSVYMRQMTMKQLEHNCKEMSRISDEITSLYNKWRGYQVSFYRAPETACFLPSKE